jgi:hypothetical protein
LKNAEAALLSLENRVLNDWRNTRAREYRQLERDGAPPEALAAALAELKLMCPDDTQVPINKRFSISSLVRDVLGDRTGEVRLDTPVNVLRGGSANGYEKRRAEILAAAESDSTSPLEAA